MSRITVDYGEVGGGGKVYQGTTPIANPATIDFGFVPKKIIVQAYGSDNYYATTIYDEDLYGGGKRCVRGQNSGGNAYIAFFTIDVHSEYVTVIKSLSGTQMEINAYTTGNYYGTDYYITAIG